MGYAIVGAEIPHGIHLILHQGDERGDDDGGALHEQRRQLIAERLASAGGHKHEHVVAVHQREYYFLLVAFEIVKSEMDFQGVCKLLLSSHGFLEI